MIKKIVHLVLMSVLTIALLNSCTDSSESNPTGSENSLPNCTTTSPLDGSTYELLTNMVISADASDSDGNIIGVVFYIDENPIDTVYTFPFKTEYYLSMNEEISTHIVKVKAVDNDNGESFSSVTINVIEPGNYPPTCSIESPQNNQSFNILDNINITVNAQDHENMIDKVEIYLDNTIISIDSIAPYNYSYNVSIDNQIGEHMIKAIVFDCDSLCATDSLSVNFTEPDNYLPTCEITSPLENSIVQVGTYINIQALADDYDGTINEVRFYFDEEPIGSDQTFPYTFEYYLNSATPFGIHTIKAIAIDNEGGHQESIVKLRQYGQIDRDVSNPNSSTVWRFGEYSIEWDGVNSEDSLMIELLTNNGQPYTISESTPDNGLFNFNLPENFLSSTWCRLKFTDLGDSCFYFYSDYFDYSSVPIVLWWNSYPTNTIDVVNEVVVSNENHYILGKRGRFQSSSYDGLIIKTNLNGTQIWSKTYGDTDQDVINDGIELPNGDLILVGSTKNNTAGNYDGWILKVDSSGNVIWSKVFGDTGLDSFNSIVSYNEDIVVSGIKRITYDKRQAWTLKMNSEGEIIWEGLYGNDNDEQHYETLSTVITEDNNIIIAGKCKTNNGSFNGFLKCINSDGVELWSNTYFGRGYDEAFSVTADENNNIIFCGRTKNSASSTFSSNWIVKTDDMGTEIWNRKYGNSNINELNSVTMMSNGNIFAVGSLETSTNVYGTTMILNDNGSIIWDEDYSDRTYTSVKSLDDCTNIIVGTKYSTNQAILSKMK
ncbi:MAG: hypothetical protein JXR48_02745 [Candidatus Delongbacteria bacterium]|nr:hypothetical protein [Candidatus Delongbacteria bacterium]MBN2833865.1 hypothetical protein [Candidatus Delongbacteria bacterium]